MSCSLFTTDSSGNLGVGIQDGMPRVMIESSRRNKLCREVGATTSPKKSAAGRQKAGLPMVITMVGILGASFTYV